MTNKLIFQSLMVTLIATLLCRPCTASHNSPRLFKTINVTGADRPESVAFGGRYRDGPYTGVSDGRILKWSSETHDWTNFAFHNSPRNQCVFPVNPAVEDICGRPLGLRFHHKTGYLYYADAYFGLSVVGPIVYETWDRTGRLIEYNILTKQVRVLVRNISFANGVSLSKDGRFVVVAEFRLSRILRYWLKGSRAGEVDVFAELPGDPDNIRRNSDGTSGLLCMYVGPTMKLKRKMGSYGWDRLPLLILVYSISDEYLISFYVFL